METGRAEEGEVKQEVEVDSGTRRLALPGVFSKNVCVRACVCMCQ